MTQPDFENFEPLEILVVNDLETLRAIAEPTRLRIMEVLEAQIASSKQIAKRLGTTNSKLYYHLNLLEEVGLIKIVGSSTTRNLTEKYYRAMAKSLEISRSVLAGAGIDKEVLDELLNNSAMASIDTTRMQIQKGILNKTKGTFSGGRASLSLTESQVHEIRDRISKLIKEYEDEKPKEGPTSTYVLASFIYPYEEKEEEQNMSLDQ